MTRAPVPILQPDIPAGPLSLYVLASELGEVKAALTLLRAEVRDVLGAERAYNEGYADAMRAAYPNDPRPEFWHDDGYWWWKDAACAEPMGPFESEREAREDYRLCRPPK